MSVENHQCGDPEKFYPVSCSPALATPEKMGAADMGTFTVFGETKKMSPKIPQGDISWLEAMFSGLEESGASVQCYPDTWWASILFY